MGTPLSGLGLWKTLRGTSSHPDHPTAESGEANPLSSLSATASRLAFTSSSRVEARALGPGAGYLKFEHTVSGYAVVGGNLEPRRHRPLRRRHRRRGLRPGRRRPHRRHLRLRRLPRPRRQGLRQASAGGGSGSRVAGSSFRDSRLWGALWRPKLGPACGAAGGRGVLRAVRACAENGRGCAHFCPPGVWLSSIERRYLRETTVGDCPPGWSRLPDD